MRTFENDYKNVKGGSYKEIFENKVDLIAQEVVELGKIIDTMAKDNGGKRHKSSAEVNQNGEEKKTD